MSLGPQAPSQLRAARTRAAGNSPAGFRHRRHDVVFLSLGLLLLVGCQRVEVLNDLREDDAVEVIVLLGEHGIAARKQARGSGEDAAWSIAVAPADAGSAFRVLTENERPRREPEGFAELLGGSRLVPTETEERARFLQAQCGELERTIEAMPGVVDARVHVSLPQRDRLAEYVAGTPPPAPTAAVLVKYRPTVGAPAAARFDGDEIARIVAASIERLEAANVTVIAKEVVPAAGSLPSPGPDPLFLFYLLAALTVLLVALALVLLARNRRLARQLQGLPARATAPRS